MDLASLSPRRRELLDAAVAVTAESGLRGLTHRAVDRRAGLPEGSTSAYLRTRAALLGELTSYVAARATADVEGLAVELGTCDGDGGDEAVRLTSQMFLRWLDQPDLLLARLEVTLLAARDPQIRTSLAASRAQLNGAVATVLADRHGGTARDQAPDAEMLVAALDGVLLAALLKPRPERRDFVTTSLALLMPGRAEPPRPAAPAGPGPRPGSALRAGAGRGR
ncbi:TetR/AcrR family transcriptional regulator [Nocardioides taihuensis]|uniref:TetR/AcrR family transcriptional regulator n=1 Tax=Nocardioides taihuensis TaxID=1835606 RepID=A0ABW0BPI4_9ACTN